MRLDPPTVRENLPPRALFEDFFRDTYPWALRLAWMLSGDGIGSEDAVQEAYAAVFRKFDEIENPTAYLRIAIVNGIRGRQRRALREARYLRTVRMSVAGEDSRFAELSNSIERLPHRERVAIVLRYWDDLPESDIAAVLRIKPASVRSVIFRAIARLRLEIEK